MIENKKKENLDENDKALGIGTTFSKAGRIMGIGYERLDVCDRSE